MERITRSLAVAVLVFGVQSAWSDEIESPSAGAEQSVNVAALGSSSSDRQAGAPVAQRSEKADSIPELMGLSARDGFPSRGGPIDD